VDKITIIQSELRLLSKLLKTGKRNSDSNLMEWSSTKSGARFALFRSFAIECCKTISEQHFTFRYIHENKLANNKLMTRF